MSIVAGIAITIIVIIRCFFIHQLPKKTLLIMWSIVLVRLLIPFTVPTISNTHGVNFTNGAIRSVPQTSIISLSPAATQSIASHAPLFANSANNGVHIAITIWILGMALLSLFFIISHIRFRKDYVTALPVENDFIKRWLHSANLFRKIQVKQSDRIAIPMTYGILKPIILFPKTTNWQDKEGLNYVLIHELAHVKRFDVLFKFIISLTLWVHWFNPLVWVMYVLVNRDIELACDEATLCIHGYGTKRAYAYTLISLEQKKSGFSPIVSHFCKNPIEERIISIMKARKSTISAVMLAVVLVIFTVGVVYALSGTSEETQSLIACDYTESYYYVVNYCSQETSESHPTICLEPDGMTTGEYRYITGSYRSFYTPKGEFINVNEQYAYAVAIHNSSGPRPFYTRDRLFELLDAGERQQVNPTDVRQAHIAPIPGYIWAGITRTGGNGPFDLCDNTFYTVLLEERVCTSCGYIFTHEQNLEINWNSH